MSETSTTNLSLPPNEEAMLEQLTQAWRHQREAQRVDPGSSPSILGTLALGTVGGGGGGAALAAIGSALLATAPAGHGLMANPLVVGTLGVSAAAGAVVATAALFWEQRKNHKKSIQADETVERLEQSATTEFPRLSQLLEQRRQKAYDQVDAAAVERAKVRNEHGNAVAVGAVIGTMARRP
jgi:hypothetical protein